MVNVPELKATREGACYIGEGNVFLRAYVKYVKLISLKTLVGFIIFSKLGQSY